MLGVLSEFYAPEKQTIHAKGLDIGIYTNDFKNEFMSLTGIARYQNIDDPRFVIRNWMRNRDTIEFLGIWETLYNPNFKRAEFDTFRSEAGRNAFTPKVIKWCNEETEKQDRTHHSAEERISAAT